MTGTKPTNLRFLYDLERQDIKVVTAWCMNMGYIAKNPSCSKCGFPMRLGIRTGLVDGLRWICRNSKRCSQRSIKKGSWFTDTRLPLSELLLLTYMWVKEIPSVQIEKELHLSSSTVSDWKKYCRDMCKELCIRESQKIGGADIFVEIEERVYNNSKKCTYAGIERDTKKCFFQICDEQSVMSLLSVIAEWVLPGSVIVSDCFKKYDHLSDDILQLGQEQMYVFKPLEPAQLDIEGSWASIKRIVKQSSLKNEDFNDCIAEYIWRHRHKDDENDFLSFMNAAAATVSEWNDASNVP